MGTTLIHIMQESDLSLWAWIHLYNPLKKGCTYRIDIHKCLVVFLCWVHALYVTYKLLLCLVKMWSWQKYGSTWNVKTQKTTIGKRKDLKKSLKTSKFFVLGIHRMTSPLWGYKVYTLTPCPLNNPKFSMFSISTASRLKAVCLCIALFAFT